MTFLGKRSWTRSRPRTRRARRRTASRQVLTPIQALNRECWGSDVELCIPVLTWRFAAGHGPLGLPWDLGPARASKSSAEGSRHGGWPRWGSSPVRTTAVVRSFTIPAASGGHVVGPIRERDPGPAVSPDHYPRSWSPEPVRTWTVLLDCGGTSSVVSRKPPLPLAKGSAECPGRPIPGVRTRHWWRRTPASRRHPPVLSGLAPDNSYRRLAAIVRICIVATAHLPEVKVCARAATRPGTRLPSVGLRRWSDGFDGVAGDRE
jgi:hypothetical protein